MVALAGPVSSALLALAFYLLSQVGTSGAETGILAQAQGSMWPAAVAVLGYLATINGTLALFNIVPAFPLDGGRVLRSILWGWRDDLRWATRLASRIGRGFAYILLGLGAVYLLLGQFSGGLWFFVLGIFLNNAARASYQQMIVREALQGEPVRRFMSDEAVTVSPDISVQSLVEDYVYRYHHKMYPVVDEGELVGCVSTRTISEVPREQWAQRTVGSLIRECSPDNTIAPAADALEALSKMSRTHNSRLMVLDGGHLVGVISLKDLLSFLSMKVDLEG
jgi:CBS domain-containing protein